MKCRVYARRGMFVYGGVSTSAEHIGVDQWSLTSVKVGMSGFNQSLMTKLHYYFIIN